MDDDTITHIVAEVALEGQYIEECSFTPVFLTHLRHALVQAKGPISLKKHINSNGYCLRTSQLSRIMAIVDHVRTERIENMKMKMKYSLCNG